MKSAGNVGLRFNNARGLRLWDGETEVEGVDDETQVDLEEGTHIFTLAVFEYDKKDRNLSIEVFDAPGSTAQVQVVNGK